MIGPHTDSPICSRFDIVNHRISPTRHAEFFPHLTLILAIDPHGIMRCRGSDIRSHDGVLIGIDTAITNHSLGAKRPLEAKHVAVTMAWLVIQAKLPDVQDKKMTIVAHHQITRVVEMDDTLRSRPLQTELAAVVE